MYRSNGSARALEIRVHIVTVGPKILLSGIWFYDGSPGQFWDHVREHLAPEKFCSGATEYGMLWAESRVVFECILTVFHEMLQRAFCSFEYGFGIGVFSKQFGQSCQCCRWAIESSLSIWIIGVCRPVTVPSYQTGDVVKYNRSGTGGSLVSLSEQLRF